MRTEFVHHKGFLGCTFPRRASGCCHSATAAPSHRASAENISPRCRPRKSLPAPKPSAIHPTTVGPTIWPAANTMVKALMPAAHWLCGKLWRTMAVVLATTDKNTPPNITPDSKTKGQAAVSASKTVAQPSSATGV